eukprot:gene14313-30473_t
MASCGDIEIASRALRQIPYWARTPTIPESRDGEAVQATDGCHPTERISRRSASGLRRLRQRG